MVPMDKSPPIWLFTDHVTAVLVVPVTVAVNNCMVLKTRAAVAGLTTTLILEFGTVTSTVLAPDTAEPGFGFVTVTETLPTWLASAVPVAVNCVEETNVVASGVVPKFTTAPFTKPVPVRVSVNAPVVTEEGVTVVRTGIGFTSVIAEFPDCVLSMTLVAVTVMLFAAGTVSGAE